MSMSLTQSIAVAEHYESSLRTEVVSLKELVFTNHGECGSMSVGKHRFNLTQHSARALCKRASLPYSLMYNGSEALVQSAWAEYASVLEHEYEVAAVVHTNSADGIQTLRGVIDAGQTLRKVSSLLKTIHGVMGHEVEVQSASWDTGRHAPVFRTRLVWPKSQMKINGDEVYLGLDCLNSDVNALPEQINLLLYRQVCTNGLIATFGRRPYFYFDPRKVTFFDMETVMGAIVGRVAADRERFAKAVETAQLTACDKAQATKLLTGMIEARLLPRGFVQKTLKLVEAEPTNTMWDTVNHITATARGYRDDLRIRYETVGGTLLGMDLDRSKTEDSFAGKSKPVLCLPAKAA